MKKKSAKRKSTKKKSSGTSGLSSLNKRVTSIEKIITKSGMKAHYG